MVIALELISRINIVTQFNIIVSIVSSLSSELLQTDSLSESLPSVPVSRFLKAGGKDGFV